MKLKDITGMREFFTTLFDFLITHGITSSLEPVDDMNGLMSSLLDSELTAWMYNHWDLCIDIDYRAGGDEQSVNLFLLANEKREGSGPHLLVDVMKDTLSFIGFSFDTDKGLPAVHGLLRDAGHLIRRMTKDEVDELRARGVMTMGEFRALLDRYPRQGRLVWVNVD